MPNVSKNKVYVLHDYCNHCGKKFVVNEIYDDQEWVRDDKSCDCLIMGRPDEVNTSRREEN